MSNATSELTDVIDVIGDGIQPHDLRRRLAAFPAAIQHPRVERYADYCAALHKPLDLLIGELTITRNQRAAIVMTRKQAAGKEIQCLRHAWIRQVGDIEDHPEA